jgi:hypothetical protein
MWVDGTIVLFFSLSSTENYQLQIKSNKLVWAHYVNNSPTVIWSK